MKHLEYIDGLKGFAIFLVVFAHVIAWSYDDLDAFQTNMKESWLFWMIYSFHMPLFFFISGYLAYLSFSRSSPFQIVKKRTLQLLLPYIAATFFVDFILQQTMNYWFLIALYWMYCVTAISQKIRWAHPLLLYVLIYGITIVFPSLNELEYLFIPSFKFHYVSFLLGFYLCKYPMVCDFLRNRFFPYSFFCFIFLFMLPLWASNFNAFLQMGGGKMDMIFRFMKSTCGVVCFYYLFELEWKNMPFASWFAKIGRDSLIIYIIHVLFKYAIPPLGKSLEVYMDYPVLVQMAYALPISILLIYVSLYTKVIFSRDSVLSTIILGKK